MIFCVCIFITLYFFAAANALRVGIVGAGASGSSAAYFLNKELGASVDIHMFESSDRVGGRARLGSVGYGNQTFTFEQGASMFISENRHLMDMAQRFNLSLCQHPCTNDSKAAEGLASYGIWQPPSPSSSSGGKWVFRRSDKRSWTGWFMDPLKLLWRYGGARDLSHVSKRTQEAVDEYLQSYKQFDKVHGSWEDFLKDKPTLKSSLYYRAIEYYKSAGENVGSRFLEEVVSLATRVNYMQDIGQINALGAHISMAATVSETDPYSVRGGNWQIFAHMLNDSQASLHLNTAVTSIQHHQLQYVVTTDGSKEHLFDIVIIAAPLPAANIDLLDGRYRQEIADVEYVKMYVTFVIGTLRPFDGLDGQDIPQLVVTPYGTTEPFNCLSILACLSSSHQKCRDGPVLTKIFSHQPVDLDKVFVNVEWSQQKQWYSYPKLAPLDAGFTSNDPKLANAFRPHRNRPMPIALHNSTTGGGGVYYINGMEALFSTMESQTVAARYVVRLALYNL